jgi:hypothetical protein
MVYIAGQDGPVEGLLAGAHMGGAFTFAAAPFTLFADGAARLTQSDAHYQQQVTDCYAHN